MCSLTNFLKKRRFMSYTSALVFTVIFINSIVSLSVLADKRPRVVDPHLYALEKDGKLSFILGTIHFGVEMREFPSFVIEALERQKLFVAEVIKSTKIEKKKQDNFSLLSSEVKSSLLLRGMSKEDINSHRPETLCMVYLLWDYLDADMENKYVLDGQFENYAISKGKELRELDLNEELMDQAIDELFECDLQSFIKKIPVDLASNLLDEILSESSDRYRNEREQDLGHEGEFDSTLRRNQSWVPLIADYHGEGFFAVVGASHFDPYHEKGLLTLLKGNGFRVTRIGSNQKYEALLKKYQPQRDL